MAEPARKKADYNDLQVIPENTIGEINDGELVVGPPTIREARIGSVDNR